MMLVLGYKFIRQQNTNLSRSRLMLLWSLRCLAVVLILVCLLDLRRVSQREITQGASLQALVDDSSSMYDKAKTSRAVQAAELMQGKIAPLAQKHNAPVALSYSATNLAAAANPAHATQITGSNLLSHIGRSLELNPQRINALLVFSDGAWSDAHLMENTISNLQAAKIPVFCWPLGDDKQIADTRLLSARITQPNAAQPRLRLQATFHNSGYAEAATQLVISYKGQQLASHKLNLAQGEQHIELEFNSPFRGLNFYDLTLTPQEGEQNTANNSLRAACELTRDPLRVLYMEGSEPQEVSYLKEAMESDQDFEIDCLHFPSHLVTRERNKEAIMARLRGADQRIFRDMYGRPVPSVCHPTQGFPKTLQELLHYDVIIVSDIIKEAFTEQQYKDMVNFVEHHAGGFVMIGGDTSFGAGNYHKTPVEKLMPIEVGSYNDMIWQELRPEVTPAGWQHPIMQVGDSSEETMRAWTTNFPGFGGTNNIKRAKPGAITLANSVYARGPAGAMSFLLFSVQDIGAGRTMAFASDTTAAWGDRFETIWGPENKGNKYYKRFWNNALRWLASGKVAEKSANLQLVLSSPQIMQGNKVEITIPSPSAGLPAALQLKLTDPQAMTSELRCEWNAAKSAWVASFKAEQLGDYSIEASCLNNSAKPVTRQCGVWVHDINNETTATALNRTNLEKISKQTGGALLDAQNYRELLEPLCKQQQQVVLKSENSLWDRWWLLLLVLLLLCSEWIIRKTAGNPSREKLEQAG